MLHLSLILNNYLIIVNVGVTDLTWMMRKRITDEWQG